MAATDWRDEVSYRTGSWLIDYIEKGFTDEPGEIVVDALKKYKPSTPITVYRGIPYTLLGLHDLMFKAPLLVGDVRLYHRDIFTSWSRSIDVARNYAHGYLDNSSPDFWVVLSTQVTPDEVLVDNDSLPRELVYLTESDHEVITHPGDFQVTIEDIGGVELTQQLLDVVDNITPALDAIKTLVSAEGVLVQLLPSQLFVQTVSLLKVDARLKSIEFINFKRRVSLGASGTALQGKAKVIKFRSPVELLTFLQQTELLADAMSSV